jgi:recombinational DNA repair ATPase RecF
MIKKIYIDNFRCLVNFQIDLQSNQLWLGANGTGKSSVIDALCKLQRVLDGDSVADVFSTDDLTLWQSKTAQTINITMSVGEDDYEYSLVVECDREQRRCRIRKEQLTWNKQQFSSTGVKPICFASTVQTEKPRRAPTSARTGRDPSFRTLAIAKTTSPSSNSDEQYKTSGCSSARFPRW